MWSFDSTTKALMQQVVVAYFSMEIGLDSDIPTYSGGLGVLAGDMLRAASDIGLPMVAVSLLYRKGHFRQQLDADGHQSEHPAAWEPEQRLERLPEQVTVTVEGQAVCVGAWRYDLRGESGHVVPVYLLDTALPQNRPEHQGLTDHLYGGDDRYRLCQEAILGLGGVAILRALGYGRVLPFHMNEGHSALLTLALLDEHIGGPDARAGESTEDLLEFIRQRCVFTTHTPVDAGHDRFPLDLVRHVLGGPRTKLLEALGCCADGMLNMTELALHGSRFTNGVSLRHESVSRCLFRHEAISSVTNGVHAGMWAAPSVSRLYDRYLPGWRSENQYLRYARRIPLDELREAHTEAKRALLTEVRSRTGIELDETILTIGFARRATGYKRADLLFSDVARLKGIASEQGRLQLLYAGKAHPHDHDGKAAIRRVFDAARRLGDDVMVLYLEDYDMALGKALCAGVDLWLNTPLKPLEASGTSGMKAALNGVPSLSVLDGWWVEGHIEGVTGWSIDEHHPCDDPAQEVASLYGKLATVIMPMYYRRPDAYTEVMRSAIAINGSFFTAQRMVRQYVQTAYQIFG